MTPFVFTAQHVDEADNVHAIHATTNDGRLRGVVFVWRGGRLVDYSLTGHGPADCFAVPYDWATSVVLLAFTPDTFAVYLADYFGDMHNLAACRNTLARQ